MVPRGDPYTSHTFALEIDQIQVACFLEFSGLRSVTEPFEIREGGLNGSTHLRPGQARFGTVVLRVATQASNALFEWREQVMHGDLRAHATDSAAVVMYGPGGQEVRRFSFTRAWPVRWEGPVLHAGRSDVAVESLELAFEGLRVS